MSITSNKLFVLGAGPCHGPDPGIFDGMFYHFSGQASSKNLVGQRRSVFSECSAH